MLFCWPFTFTDRGIYLGRFPETCVLREARQRSLSVAVPPMIRQPGSPVQLPDITEPETEDKPPNEDETLKEGDYVKQKNPVQKDKPKFKSSSQGNRGPTLPSKSRKGPHKIPTKGPQRSSSRSSPPPSESSSSSSSQSSSSSSPSSSSTSSSSLYPSPPSRSSRSSYSSSQSSTKDSSSNDSSKTSSCVKGMENHSTTDRTAAKKSRLPTRSENRNRDNVQHSDKTAKKSSIAPTKKKVRFARVVNERPIPEVESSVSSSNSSNDSYIDPTIPQVIRVLVSRTPTRSVEQHPSKADNSHHRTSRSTTSHNISKNIPRSKVESKADNVESENAKSSASELPRGSTFPSNGKLTRKKRKSSQFYKTPYIIPQLPLALGTNENEEIRTGSRGTGDITSRLKGRGVSRASSSQAPPIVPKPRKGHRSHSITKPPEKGLQYDERTGKWFRDV